MQVDYKEIEDCKIEATYIANQEDVIKKRKEAVAHLKNVQIPGFRKGKASDNVIRTVMRKDIEEWVESEMQKKAFIDVAIESKSKPIGQFDILESKLNKNNFECKISFLRRPEFELGEYKNFDIPKPHASISVENLTEQMLQELRNIYRDTIPYSEDDFVQTGDHLVVNFKITEENTDNILMGHAENTTIAVGNNVIPEIDDNLLGMKVGETKEFEIHFKEDFPEFGGKRAKAVFTIISGNKNIPASLDDDLAKKVNLNSYNDLLKEVESVASAKVKNIESDLIAEQVINRLVNNHDFSVPEILINQQIYSIAIREGIEYESIDSSVKEKYKSKAIDEIKLSFILDRIREVETDSRISDMDLINSVKEKIGSLGSESEKFLAEAQGDARLLMLAASIKDEYTLQWVINSSNIIE